MGVELVDTTRTPFGNPRMQVIRVSPAARLVEAIEHAIPEASVGWSVHRVDGVEVGVTVDVYHDLLGEPVSLVVEQVAERLAQAVLLFRGRSFVVGAQTSVGLVLATLRLLVKQMAAAAQHWLAVLAIRCPVAEAA